MSVEEEMHSYARRLLLAVVITALTCLCGCGANEGARAPIVPTGPTFTSTPPTAASEGATYAYQLAANDPSGDTITFTLTEAPAGATLTGTALTWTPTAAQSRKANAFTVRATTAKGASATQTWSVTPSGTVHLSWVDTYWDENGSSTQPFDWTQTLPELGAAVVIQKPDGSAQTLTGTGDANGQVSIPSVPGGYYWLRVTPREWYWTNASSFDLGADFNSRDVGGLTIIGEGTPTTFNFNVTGLEPVSNGYVTVAFDRGFGFSHFLFNNETSFDATYIITSNIDWTKVTSANAFEYKGIPLGDTGAVVLGPWATVKNLTLTNGGTNNLDVPLQPSPQKSFNLSIRGSAWVPLFAKVAPGTATPYITTYDLSVDPDVSNTLPLWGRSIRLMQPNLSFGSMVNGVPFGRTFTRSSCSGYSGFGFAGAGLPLPLPATSPLVITDQNYGTINYGDPFPEAWTRYFELCQQATVDVPDPGGSSTPVQMLLSNGATIAVPTAPVEPLVGPVENPTINDANLFTAATFTGPIKLKWTKPSLGTPKGYIIRVMTAMTLPNGSTSIYMTMALLGTATTEVTLPPTLLVPGKTYLFQITSVVDARTNMELSPRRVGVPMANADIVSAPITIGGVAN